MLHVLHFLCAGLWACPEFHLGSWFHLVAMSFSLHCYAQISSLFFCFALTLTLSVSIGRVHYCVDFHLHEAKVHLRSLRYSTILSTVDPCVSIITNIFTVLLCSSLCMLVCCLVHRTFFLSFALCGSWFAGMEWETTPTWTMNAFPGLISIFSTRLLLLLLCSLLFGKLQLHLMWVV